MQRRLSTRRSRFSVLALFVALIVAVAAEAAVPTTVNYQGRLTSADGRPLHGTVTVIFRLYDVAEGGSALWEETQSVTLSKGYFNVELGSISPLSAAVFTNPVFLGVTVGTDSEMTPRRPLSSVPYAFKSATTDGGGASGFQSSGLTVYQVSNPYCPGAGANIASFQSTCQTATCGATYCCGTFCSSSQCPYYFTCAGSCDSKTSQTCSNTSVGSIVVAP